VQRSDRLQVETLHGSASPPTRTPTRGGGGWRCAAKRPPAGRNAARVSGATNRRVTMAAGWWCRAGARARPPAGGAWQVRGA